MQRLFKLAQDVAQDLCSASGQGHKSDDPNNGELMIRLRIDFQQWDEYWKQLKPQIPDNSPELPPEAFDESLKTELDHSDGETEKAVGIKAEESEDDENIHSALEHTDIPKAVRKKGSSTRKRVAPNPKALPASKRARNRKSKPTLKSSSKASAARKPVPKSELTKALVEASDDE